MSQPFKRPSDPRNNILGLEMPYVQFFRKPEYSLKQYISASFLEHKKMINQINGGMNGARYGTKLNS